MEATRKRNIRSGEKYNQLFPKAEGSTSTIRKNASVTHTVAFIPKVVNETLHQTQALAKKLKGKNTYETCSNIWYFVYQHIAYKKDQDGYEQIRSPARAWHDRKTGVDCDCYSVFISSILTNLAIPHILRITKYHRDYFQHIYPVVPLNDKEIILDCVTDQFNYEVPYSEKKDYPMDLQYLNGFDNSDELGKVRKSTEKKSLSTLKKKPSLFAKLQAKKGIQPNGTQPKTKGFFKKAVNKVNKVNPATVLLRNGILAAMKLNIKNVAKRLRWSYLAPEQAAKQAIDPQKFQRLLATRQKLEKIFYGAGGNPTNLKKAILGGKGNSDKAVHGLDGLSTAEAAYMSTATPLPQLLGHDIYYSENASGFDGLGQLGEPVTIASVGAAMGVLAGIIASLKQIGDIFQKKGEGSKDFDEKTNEAAENNVPVPGTTALPSTPNSTSAPISIDNGSTNDLAQRTTAPTFDSDANTFEPSTVTSQNESPMNIEKDDSLLPASTSNVVATTNQSSTPTQETFWDKNKSWLKPIAIGVGGISLIAIGLSVLKPKKKSNRSSRPSSLSGIPKYKKKRKKHHRKKKHAKKRHTKKRAVALL